MARPPDKRVVGEPIRLTPEQLDKAAETTAVDVALAAALWRLKAPPALRDLLDAAPDGGDRA